MKRQPEKTPRERLWRIVALRKKGEVLGRVRAASAEAAIERAAVTFGVAPERVARLAAQPIKE